MEVETPMLQTIPGGASARPFVTHHNAMDMNMYLRIAPELYLKRLVVGGFERVFEINRNFRNEGVSTRHNPEFTMIEFYQAYADYKDLMDLTEDMLRTVAEKVLGTTKVTYQGSEYDFGASFVRMTMLESILHYNPELTEEDLSTVEKATVIAKKLKIDVKPIWGLGKTLDGKSSKRPLSTNWINRLSLQNTRLKYRLLLAVTMIMSLLRTDLSFL